MAKKSATKKRVKGMPPWATAPFQLFLDDIDRLEHVVHLSCFGISLSRSTPEVIELLMEVKNDCSKESDRRLEHSRQEAEFAEREVASGFPVLHAWAVVGLWAHLESLIRSFLIEWLKHKRSARTIEEIARVKVRLGEYERIPRDQRNLFIVGILERELGAALRKGIDRFEVMLAPFGLDGELPDLLRREIYELGQVRNVIAHNATKIDRHLLKACPWLKGKVGDYFQVSPEMFNRYSIAAMAYVNLIICRIGKHFGVNTSERRASMERKVEKLLSKKSM